MKLKIQILDSLSEPSRDPNEDLWGATEHSVWVIDGATTRADGQLLPGPTDAYWLVQRCQNYLEELADQDGSAQDLFDELQRRILSDFERDALIPGFVGLHRPAACLTMVRARGMKLEFIHLGDCESLLSINGENAQRMGSSNIGTLDRLVLEEMTRRRKEVSVPYLELWPHMEAIIRTTRAKMNRPDGYWVLDVTPRWLSHLQISEVDFAPGDRAQVLMMTDGYYRLVETFKKYDHDLLMDAVAKRQLRSLLAELRELEHSDMECVRYPRIKRLDDATAVWVQVEAV